MKKVLEKLKKMKDKKYGEFQAKLLPIVDKNIIIGVRTPKLKTFAKEMLKGSKSVTSTNGMSKDVESFLDELPHKYFDENQLHVFILSEIKNFDICIKRVNDFLPYINNWATCDQLSPKCFKKNKDSLLKYIYKWIKSKKPYVIRFAIEMLMSHFLDEDFDEKYLKMVSDVNFNGSRNNKNSKNRKIKSSPTKISGYKNSNKSYNDRAENISVEVDSDKYYVEMMRAWYFATALAKQYDAAFPFVKNHCLNAWTHNKTIQKACESFRVSESHKKELKKYKN